MFRWLRQTHMTLRGKTEVDVRTFGYAVSAFLYVTMNYEILKVSMSGHSEEYFPRYSAILFAFFITVLALPSLASAADHFIAQSAAGSADGSSCVNARAVSFFNRSSNWGTGAGQITAGDTVRLCGTITTNLTFQGDGANGNHITIDGTGATMSATFVAGANKAYGKIQNVTWVHNFGDRLFNCTSCDNFVFANNYADNWHGGQAIYVTEDGTNQQPSITVSNNYIRTSTGNFGDVQKDIIFCASCVNTVIEGNHFEMRIVGQDPYKLAHDDIVQTFRTGGASLGPPSNLTMRYNKLVMNVITTQNAHRSWCMLEHLGGTNYFYGNIMLGLNGADGSNGCAIFNGQTGVVHNFIGNTLVSKGTASNNQLNFQGTGTINIRDNVFYLAANQIYTMTMATINRSNNLWYGTRAPACLATEICNQDPQFTDYTNNDFSLQSGSPANNTGANLGAPYNEYLVPGTTWPNPILGDRPASGAWEMGAFEIEGPPPPIDTTPPTVSISAPSPDTTYSAAQTVTITADASDDIGVSKVELYDGATLKGSDTTSPYTYDWPITYMDNGGHSFTAKAYDAAGNTATSTPVSLTVNIPIPPFDFSCSPLASTSLLQGESGTRIVTATLLSGVTEPVSFSVSGLPAGTTASFSSMSCNPTCTSTLTLTTSGTPGSVTPTGDYSLTITGTSSSLIRTVPLTLTVMQSKFLIGDRVQTTAKVNVRSCPANSCTLLGIQINMRKGTVIGGPVRADGSTWWNINYDSGVDGWSVEDGLVKLP